MSNPLHSPLLVMPFPPRPGDWWAEYARQWRGLILAQQEVLTAQQRLLELQLEMLDRMEKQAAGAERKVAL
jgi:hypothetical protein